MREQYSNVLVEFFERMSSWENGIVSGREVSLAQMHVLETVGNNEPLRMKELSDRLGVTTGTLTVMVQRLVSRDYLRREKDPVDQRSYFVYLTDKGRAEYEYHHSLHAQVVEEILAELGEQGAEDFFTTMNRISRLM